MWNSWDCTEFLGMTYLLQNCFLSLIMQIASCRVNSRSCLLRRIDLVTHWLTLQISSNQRLRGKYTLLARLQQALSQK